MEHLGWCGASYVCKNVVGIWLMIADVKSHEVFCVRIFPQYSNIGEIESRQFLVRFKLSWSQTPGAVLLNGIAFYFVVKKKKSHFNFIPEYITDSCSQSFFLPQSCILLQNCAELIPVFIFYFQFISLPFPLLPFSSHCHRSVLAAVPLP